MTLYDGADLRRLPITMPRRFADIFARVVVRPGFVLMVARATRTHLMARMGDSSAVELPALTRAAQVRILVPQPFAYN